MIAKLTLDASLQRNTSSGLSIPATQAIAGSLGGGLSLLITYPLCLLSIRSQFSKQPFSGEIDPKDSDSFPASDKITQAKKLLLVLRKIGEIFVRLITAIRKWYAGVSSALLAQLLIQYTYYYAYTNVRCFFARYAREIPSLYIDIISSTIAGACGATVSQPLWVINTKKSVDNNQQATTSLFFDLIQQRGLRSLFNGLLPSYVLVLNPVIAYSIFEGLKRLALQGQSSITNALSVEHSRKLSAMEIFVYSAFGKIVATLFTYPYMVARNIMQYGSLEKISGDSKASNSGCSATGRTLENKLSTTKGGSNEISIMKAWKYIISNQGFKGLYRGLESKIIQSVLNHSLLFLFQDRIYAAISSILL